MKNSETRHIVTILTFCIIGLIMITIANPNANPIIIYWQSEALQGLTAAFGGIFIWIGFVYALAKICFLSEERQRLAAH